MFNEKRLVKYASKSNGIRYLSSIDIQVTIHNSKQIAQNVVDHISNADKFTKQVTWTLLLVSAILPDVICKRLKQLRIVGKVYQGHDSLFLAYFFENGFVINETI